MASMARRAAFLVAALLASCGSAREEPQAAPAPPPAAAPTRGGVFGFPQAEAQVLRDDESLRVSVWNDARHLVVQAFVWGDADDALGETPDGRQIGDRSYLRLDVDADGAVTPEVDRVYCLNPWPERPGLRSPGLMAGGRASKFQSDSAGRGSIQYVDAGSGRLARVDTYAIPLAEIARRPGQTVRLAYWATTVRPNLTLSSIATALPRQDESMSLPVAEFAPVQLADRTAALDASLIPEGREDAANSAGEQLKPVPAIGAVPPELGAAEWINAREAPTLAGLRGRVVLIEFFSPSCATCISAIAALNDLHDRYAADGLSIIAFAPNSRRGIEWFIEKNPMRYTVGAASNLRTEYGAASVPYAYLIGRDGRLLWHGDSMSPQLHERVADALR